MSDVKGTWDFHCEAIIALLGQPTNSDEERAACNRFYKRAETDEDIDLMWSKYDQYITAMKAEKKAIRAADSGCFVSMSLNRWGSNSRASALRHIDFMLRHVSTLTREDDEIKNHRLHLPSHKMPDRLSPVACVGGEEVSQALSGAVRALR